MSVPNISSVKLPKSDKDVVYTMIKKAMQRKLIMTGLTVAVATTLIVIGNKMDEKTETVNEDQN